MYQNQYQRKSGKKPSSSATSSKKTFEETTTSNLTASTLAGGKGKKGGKQPKSQPGSDDGGGSASNSDDDSRSTGSQSNDFEDDEYAAAAGDSSGLNERISELLENLTAKRGSTREEALQDLKKLLTAKVLTTAFEGRLETLLDSLKKGLRRGTATENTLSAECLSLSFLLLGSDNEAPFIDIRPVLQETIRNSQDDSLRPAFLETLGLGCFILATEVDTTTSTMEFLEEVFSRNYSNPSVAAAVDAWSLLVTTLPPSRIPALVQKNLKQLKKHLSSEDNDVIIASGSAIVLLFEMARKSELDLAVSDETHDELLDTLRSLANDTDRHKARKDRSKQRATFRDILRSVEDGSSPEETLKFKQEQIVLDSWSGIRRLESFRHLLGEGLHIHFQQNDTLRQIFELPPASHVAGEPHTKMTSLEKKMYYSPNSATAKARSKWLDTRRTNKQGSTSHNDMEE